VHHTKRAFVLLAVALASCSSNPVLEHRSSDDQCAFDKVALLALDEQSFDQDLANGGGGWRGLASKQECELVAADLIAEYRSARNLESPLLFWHEGQLRAFSGQYAQAISLLKNSYKPKQQDFGWNAYADATIAFLRSDRQELDKALANLKSTPAPPDETLKDGKLEMTLSDGTKTTMLWPLNVDVVEGLQRCLGKPYREAYSSACRLGN
jgi:hypothetical protein